MVMSDMATLTLNNSNGDTQHIISTVNPAENDCIELAKIGSGIKYQKLNDDSSIDEYVVSHDGIASINFNLIDQ